MFVPSPYYTVQVSISVNKPKKSSQSGMIHDLIVFSFSEGLFPAASLGINAFSFILIVNTTPGVASQIVLSLMSAAEAQLLLRPGQVLSHYLCQHILSLCAYSTVLNENRLFVSTAVQPAHTTSVCRFFPDCKKMDCPFYHPKVKHSEV